MEKNSETFLYTIFFRKIILKSYSSLYNPLNSATAVRQRYLQIASMIYLADCPFRIPRFTHHYAELSAFLDSAFYFPHSAFYQQPFPSLGTENSIEYAKCPSPGTKNSQRNSLFSVRPSRTENSVFQTLISVPRDGK